MAPVYELLGKTGLDESRPYNRICDVGATFMAPVYELLGKTGLDESRPTM